MDNGCPWRLKARKVIPRLFTDLVSNRTDDCMARERIIYVERKPRGTVFGLGCGGFALIGLIVVLVSSMLRQPRTPTAPASDTDSAASAPAPKPVKPPVEKPWQDYAEKAFFVGQRAAERGLKAPSTAKFSNPGTDSETGWLPHGYCQWKTFGWVDAQNSFGAMLRENWYAVVRKVDDSFEIVYLKVGKSETGEMPGVALAPKPPPAAEEIAATKSAAAIAVTKQKEATVRHYESQAAKGDAFARFRLGQIYLAGEGVDVDVPKARIMFRLSAAQGNEEAKAALQKLPPE